MWSPVIAGRWTNIRLSLLCALGGVDYLFFLSKTFQRPRPHFCFFLRPQPDTWYSTLRQTHQVWLWEMVGRRMEKEWHLVMHLYRRGTNKATFWYNIRAANGYFLRETINLIVSTRKCYVVVVVMLCNTQTLYNIQTLLIGRSYQHGFCALDRNCWCLSLSHWMEINRPNPFLPAAAWRSGSGHSCSSPWKKISSGCICNDAMKQSWQMLCI
jgi:hypothetical protein